MQEQKKVESETEKLQIEIAARNRQEVALIKQEQLLQVARTDLDAAKREAKAILSRGQAAADVVRFQREAEAEALRLSIVAFPDGAAFARYEFYKKVAPRILSVFADTEGVFGSIFKEYLQSGRSKP